MKTLQPAGTKTVINIHERTPPFPLNAAIKGLYFCSFASSCRPPSRISLLTQKRDWFQKWNEYKSWTSHKRFMVYFPQRPHPLGQVLAAGRGPLHHVGEANAVDLWQSLVVWVIQLLLCESWQKQTFPCTENKRMSFPAAAGAKRKWR